MGKKMFKGFCFYKGTAGFCEKKSIVLLHVLKSDCFVLKNKPKVKNPVNFRLSSLEPVPGWRL